MKYSNRIRRIFLAVLAAAQLCAPAFAQGSAPSGISLNGERTLWLGDSITQKGTYVTFVEYVLEKQFPTQKFDIISIGLSSETASGLSEKASPFPRPCVHERLRRALNLVKPTLVVACYGMNDGIYHPQDARRMKAFQKGIERLVADVQGSGAKLILLTPPPFDAVNLKNTLPANAPDFSYMRAYSDYDSVLADYAKWEMTLSAPNIVVIDLHSAINDYLGKARQTNPKFSFVGDGIHPNAQGQLLMARTILPVLGATVSTDDLSQVLAQIQADPLFDLITKQRESRSAAWLDYVGYTRGKTVKTASVDEAEQANTTLQGQIDQMRAHGNP